MAGISTWRDLLLLGDQNKYFRISQVVDGEEQGTTNTSPLSLQLWNRNRLPTSASLIEDLPHKMQEHLCFLVDQFCSDQAARTSFTDDSGYTVTADRVFGTLRRRCSGIVFRVNREPEPGVIARHLSDLVLDIYEALVQDRASFIDRQYSSDNAVVTDHSYQLDSQVKILWEDKSPKVFDKFVEELKGQMLTNGSPIDLCTESKPTMYEGYKAVLAKVRAPFPVLRKSESSPPLACVPCRRCAASGPLGNHIQWTSLHHHLYSADNNKTYDLLLTGHVILSST
jgi:hypothetical protein